MRSVGRRRRRTGRLRSGKQAKMEGRFGNKSAQVSSRESGQSCSKRDGSGRRQICSGRAAGAGRAGPKLLSIAYAAGNAAAAVSLPVAGDAGGVTAAGGRASRCFAIRERRPCLWRGSCSIQVQGCERRSKPPKHLTSSKRSSSCFCPLFFELGVPLVRQLHKDAHCSVRRQGEAVD